MLRPGKLANIIMEMRRMKIDKLGLSEVRCKDGWDFTNEGIRVIYTEGRGGQSGVAVLLEERIAKSSVENYQALCPLLGIFDLFVP